MVSLLLGSFYVAVIGYVHVPCLIEYVFKDYKIAEIVGEARNGESYREFQLILKFVPPPSAVRLYSQYPDFNRPCYAECWDVCPFMLLLDF